MITATRTFALIATLFLASTALADDAEGTEEATEEEEPLPELPSDAGDYRYLSRIEHEALLDATGFDPDALMGCRDEEDTRIRERAVTNRIPYTLYTLPDGGIFVQYDGDDDEDGEIAECLLEETVDMEASDVPEELRNGRFRYTWYESTYWPQRRMRHAEIIGLYTLSAVSAGVGVGAFVAARNDDSEMEDRLAGVPEGSPAATHIEERPDRFRAAAWSMVGISAVSFVAGTLLYTKNRDIESRENPVLVLTPGSPTGDLGFTFSGRF